MNPNTKTPWIDPATLTSFDELVQAIRTGRVQHTTNLPTFGGDPVDGDPLPWVWSYDETRVLLGQTSAGEVVTREHYQAITDYPIVYDHYGKSPNAWAPIRYATRECSFAAAKYGSRRLDFFYREGRLSEGLISRLRARGFAVSCVTGTNGLPVFLLKLVER
jgi:hypothetical protein